jgi:hypothetical protein
MWIRFYCITFSIDNSTAGFILPKRHPHKLFIPLTDDTLYNLSVTLLTFYPNNVMFFKCRQIASDQQRPSIFSPAIMLIFVLMNTDYDLNRMENYKRFHKNIHVVVTLTYRKRQI